jgi:hypothetical protein
MARSAPRLNAYSKIDAMTDAPHQAPAQAQAPSPFTAEQLEQIAVARKRAVKVRRAAGVARFDAWTTAVFAGFTLMYVAASVLFGGLEWVALLIGIGMATVSYVAFSNAAQLRRFDLNAPRRLALNQVCFAAMIIVYCLWRMWHAASAPGLAGQSGQALDPQVAELLRSTYGQDPDELSRTLSLLIYSVVIFGSVLSQGGAALYYSTRRRYVKAFRDNTPSWVIELLAAREL